MINASVNLKVKGQVRLVVHKGDESNASIDTGFFDNLVTNNGLNAILGAGASQSALYIIPVVGSGNMTPQPTDTALQSFVAGANGAATVNTSVKHYDSTPYRVVHTFRWRFDQGDASGNISEVGLANIAGIPTLTTPLFSRALVKDSSGNPTSITVLPDEYLDVIYTITFFAGDFSSGSFDQIIDGEVVSTTYSIGPSSMSVGGSSISTPGWATNTSSGPFCLRPQASPNATFTTAYTTDVLGGAGDPPSGTGSRVGGGTSTAVNTSLHYCDFTYLAGLDESNISIGSMSLAMGAAAYKISFSPAIPKINTKTYRITVRVSVANAS